MTAFRDDPSLPVRVDAIEAAAWASLAWIGGHEAPFSVETVTGVTVSIFPGREHAANRVYGLGLERPVQQELLEAVIEAYKERGVPHFRVYVCPTARPPTLRRMLEEQGFRLESREAVLFRTTRDHDGHDPFFQIRNAGPEDTARFVRIMTEAAGHEEAWATLLAKVISDPDWATYMAFDGENAYSLGGFYGQGDGAWIGPTYTLPAYRGRGAESALLAYGLTQAYKRGCHWATTSFNLGLRARPRNFARNGFELLYLRSCYVWPGTPS